MVKWSEEGLTVTEDVIITRNEAESLVDWVEKDFIECIRKKRYSLEFVENILRIYRQCKDYLEKGKCKDYLGKGVGDGE